MGLPRIITVQGTFIKSDGTPETGSLEFYSKVYVMESDGETALVPSMTKVDLDSQGQVQVELPATDDPAWSPNNWTYTLVLRLSGDFSSKEVVIPYNSPGAILPVSHLVPTYPSGNVSGNYIPLSAKGTPNGVATLDGTGKIPSAQLPASSGGAPDWSEVLNKPTTFTPSSHTHAVLDITGLQAILDGKQAAGSYAPLSHVHTIANVTDLQTTLDGKQVAGDYATNTALTTGLAGKQPTGDYATQDDLDTKQDIGDYATNTALALKAPLASPNFTGTVSGISKSMVGLGNVDNTTDAAKPISTATQTALDAKADSSHTHSIPNVTNLQSQLDLKAPLASPTFTGTVSGISKAMVGLSNVDNTADSAKPVSTATQTALNLKANIASPTFTGTVSGITKSMVGLSNVDNTSDAGKPVSTAQQTALDLKANISSLATVATTGSYNDLLDKPSGGGSGTPATFARGYVTSGDIVPTSDATWTIIPGLSFAIAAVTGDDVEFTLNCLIDIGSGAVDFFDPVIISGGSIVRYASTGTSSPGGAGEGDPSLYPSNNVRFRGTEARFSLSLSSGDISGGNVTFGLAHKGTGPCKVFAGTAYPLRWAIRNDH